MAFKTFPVWDSPSYNTRQSFNFTQSTATAKNKWLAYANSYVYSLNLLLDTVGTGTYTGTGQTLGVTNGTTTSTLGQTIAVFAILNTSTTTTPSLSTTTFGTYVAGGTAATALAGQYSSFALNTAVSGGGFPVPQGSEISFVGGADATAIVAVSLDFQLAPLAAVTA